MLLGRAKGLIGTRPLAFLLGFDGSRRHSCIDFRVIIWVLTVEKPALDLKWSAAVTLVSFPAHATLCVSIFSNVFLRQDRTEIGLKFFRTTSFVLPVEEISKHFACFHLGGKTGCCRRLLKRSVKMLASAFMVLSIMTYNT